MAEEGIPPEEVPQSPEDAKVIGGLPQGDDVVRVLEERQKSLKQEPVMTATNNTNRFM
jgi:hypothetical protein